MELLPDFQLPLRSVAEFANICGKFVAFALGYIVHCKKKSSNVSCFFLTAEYASLNHFIAMFNFQVFPGNKDRNTVTEHLLVTAFNARLIRFHPKTYHGHTSMRVEVYGCRNGMCMHESSTHFSTYIALDPKRKLKV